MSRSAPSGVFRHNARKQSRGFALARCMHTPASGTARKAKIQMEELINGLVEKCGLDKAQADAVVAYLKENMTKLPEMLDGGLDGIKEEDEEDEEERLAKLAALKRQ